MYIIEKFFFLKDLLTASYKHKLLILPLLSCVCTSICVMIWYTIEMNVVVSFFFIGTFFVFSVLMNLVNTRRFGAIDEISSIKSYILSIYEIELLQKVIWKKEKAACLWIFEWLQSLLYEKNDNSIKWHILRVDKKISLLLNIWEKLRLKWVSSPEISRIQQQIAEIRFSFEKLVSIREIRTPVSLKLFIYMSLPLSTILLAPTFANIGFTWIMISCIISFLLSLLLTIQNDIENPFEDDIDDIHFDFTERLKERLESL